MNRSFETGTYPVILKIEVITPIYQQGEKDNMVTLDQSQPVFQIYLEKP